MGRTAMSGFINSGQRDKSIILQPVVHVELRAVRRLLQYS
jgi:hypothetical protein